MLGARDFSSALNKQFVEILTEILRCRPRCFDIILPTKMSSTGDYGSVPSTGKLKLKGVKDGKVDKKKKKSKPKPVDDMPIDEFQDRSVVLKKLEDEDLQMEKEERRKMGVVDGNEVRPGAGVEDGDLEERIKTEAERRYEEQRRKRVCYRVEPIGMMLKRSLTDSS